MITLIQKQFQKIKLRKPEIPENLDLKGLPKFICYKAALLREKLHLQWSLVGIFALLCVTVLTYRCEVSSLYDKLRTKEYILAPGVVDFTAVSPQSVPDSYVQAAVLDLVGNLANTVPQTIDEQYHLLSEQMSQKLKIQFLAESREWIQKVKEENLSEMITVFEKRVESDQSGNYKAVIKARVDSFLGSEPAGFRNEIIQMNLRLVPPQTGKRWFLEITALKRQSVQDFDSFKTLESGGGKK